MECREISSCEANCELGVAEPDFRTNDLCAGSMTICTLGVMALIILAVSGFAFIYPWIVPLVISLCGTVVTGLLLLLTPIGYWECMSLRYRFNRLLAKATNMQAMEKAGMATWTTDELDDAVFLMPNIRDGIFAVFKTARQFQENRRIAWKGGVSRKPWNTASFLIRADIAGLESRMKLVEERMVKMVLAARPADT